MHCLLVAIMTAEGGSWGYPYIEISPSQGTVGHTPRVYNPYFSRTVGVLLHPTRTRWVKVLWDVTWPFLSLFEQTRKSNRLQMSLQRQHFLLTYLKTLSVGPAGVRTPHHKVQMKIHFSSCYLCCVNKCVNSMLHLDHGEICNYFFDRNSQAIY